MGCEVDGQQYQGKLIFKIVLEFHEKKFWCVINLFYFFILGVGRNKKDAKKHCAMEALKALYNIQYPGTLNAEVTAWMK